MRFLEKDLETIIWENYTRCAEKGLAIGQEFYQHGKAYRQLNLSPYGIADLVYIRHSAAENLYFVQVLELKKGKVDAAAYMQAKRYLTAICGVLDRLRKQEELDYKIVLSSVIIGDEVELSGDFIYTYNYDVSCQAFTYSYGFDGIEFKEVSKEWAMVGAPSSGPLQSLMPELLDHYDDITTDYKRYVAEQAGFDKAFSAQYGDPTQALLITPEGVLMNRQLLGMPIEEEGEGDGAGN